MNHLEGLHSFNCCSQRRCQTFGVHGRTERLRTAHRLTVPAILVSPESPGCAHLAGDSIENAAARIAWSIGGNPSPNTQSDPYDASEWLVRGQLSLRTP